MIKYVCGFMFNEDKSKVVLIEKQKPTFMKGLLNGVGGKIEKNETPKQAMWREFYEETGLLMLDWKKFCVLNIPGESDSEHAIIHFFTAAVSEQIQKLAKTVEQEEVGIFKVDQLHDKKVMPNLAWLIPMAMRNELHNDYFYDMVYDTDKL